MQPRSNLYNNPCTKLQYGWKELETRLPQNASHICAASATKNGIFVLGTQFSGKIDVDSDSKWTELPALNSADAGCIADADEFGYAFGTA